MKRIPLLTLALILTVTSIASAKPKLKDIKCFISGKQAKTQYSTSWKNRKVYFYSSQAKKQFQKNPTKYAAQANHQLVATRQAKQMKDPLTGAKFQKQFYAEIAGLMVNFASAASKAKALSKGGKSQLELVFGDQAFQKGFKTVK